MTLDPSSGQDGELMPEAIGHYRVVRRLGGGGFGDVYEANDLERGEVVAIKVLSAPSPTADIDFKAEVRIVADLAHPNLLTPFEMLESDGRLAFAMPRIHGVDFVSAIRGGTRPDWTEARERRLFSALEQLHSALGALHRQGILHLDIKPSNVLIDEAGHLFVLDFGLSRRGETAARTAGFTGTPAYAAPELVMGGTPSEASDWYAVGVMLFEALTGRRPFPDPAKTLFFLSTFEEAPLAGSLVDSVPSALEALCAALLRRDPNLRAGADDVASCIAQTPMAVPAAEPFVGRRAELARLQAAVCDRSGPRVMLVSGPAGIGKSALLDVFVRETRARPGAPLVFTGRCFERESVPYKGFDSVIEQLHEWLADKDGEALAHYIDAGDHSVGSLFPVLGSLAPRTANGPGESRLSTVEQREQSVAILKRVLGRIAERDGLVIVLDDVQWSSTDTARLVAQLVGPPAAVAALFVFAFRAEDGRPEFVRELGARTAALEEIALVPLDATLTGELISLSDTHERPQTERERIARISEGNPFLVSWLARQSSVDLDAESLLGDSLELAPGGPEKARAYLEVVAIAGGPIPQEVAASAAGITHDERPLVAALRARRLLRTNGPRRRDQVATYHDRIRTLVVAELPPERRRHLHLSVATALETHPGEHGPHPAELAWHYHEGGLDSKAWRFARLAGEAANKALAFASAARHFGNALEWGAPGEDERRTLIVARARALADAGIGEEAAKAFEQAAGLFDGDEWRTLLRLGVEQRMLTGRLEEGVRGLRALAKVEGLPFPRTTVGALASLGLNLFRLRSRTRKLGAGRDLKGLERDDSGKASRRLELATVALRGLMTSDPVRAGFFGMLAANLALRSGDRRQIAINLIRVGAMLLTPLGPRFQRWGDELLRFAESEATALADAALMGSAAVGRAMVAFWKGAWRETFDLSDRALSTSEGRPANGVYDCNLARLMSIRSLEELGRWTEADERNREFYRDALDRGDHYAEVAALQNAAMGAIARGDAQGARDAVAKSIDRWGRRDYDVQHVYALRVEIYADLLDGDPYSAWQRVQAMWKPLKRAMHLSVATSRMDFFLLRARCALACDAHNGAHRFEAEALRCAKILAKIGRDDARAHAEAIEAVVAANRGRANAKARLGRAALLYERLEMSSAKDCAHLLEARLVGDEATAHLETAQIRRLVGIYLPTRGVNAR